MHATKYQFQLRSPLQLCGLAVAFTAILSLLFLFDFYNVDVFNEPTDTITVKLSGLAPGELGKVTCGWGKVELPLRPNSAILPCVGAHLQQDCGVWVIPAFYFGVLQLKGPDPLLDKITAIQITADGVDLKSDEGHIWSGFVKADRSDAMETGWTTYSRELPEHSGIKSANQLFKFLWMGVGHFKNSFALGSLLLILFVLLIKKARFNRALTYALIARNSERAFEWLYLWGGLILTAAALLYEEWRYPFYFVKDDNYVQFLPIIEKGANALLSNGALSTWNPYQYMGSPTTSLGVYALTYPPTYIAYAFARNILGNTHLTIDVFVFVHLIAGYAVTYFLLHEQKVRASICALGAMSFVLGGFFLIVGSAWYYVTPVAVFAPLMVLLINRFFKNKRMELGSTLAMGLCVGIFFHAGNAQMWLYGVETCFLGVLVGVLSKAIKVKDVAVLLPALIIGIGIAAPLLVVQMDETAGAIRTSAPGPFAGVCLVSLVAPVGNLFAADSAAYSVRTNEELYYSGAIFAILLLVASWYVLLTPLTRNFGPRMRSFSRKNIWLLPAVFSLVMAAGYNGFLWTLFRHLPIFSRFGQSDKFIVFAALYGIVTAAVIVERCLMLMPRRSEVILCAASFLLLCIHLYLCDSSFYVFPDAPYPELPDVAAAVLHSAAEETSPHRIVSCSPKRDIHVGFPFSLSLNFPTQYQVCALEGYEPLVSETESTNAFINEMDKDPLKLAQEYGVKFLVTYNSRPNDKLTQLIDSGRLHDELKAPRYQMWENAIVRESRLRASLADGAIYEIANAKPLAFVLTNPFSPLLATVSDKGVKIDISKVNSRESVVVNFQHRSAFIADVDGKPVRIEHDSYNRMVVFLQQKGQSLNLEFRPAWERGFGLSIALLLIGLGSFFLFRNRSLVNRPQRI